MSTIAFFPWATASEAMQFGHFQVPRFGQAAVGARPEPELGLASQTPTARSRRPDWPTSVVEQIALLRATLSVEPLTAAELANRFRGLKQGLLAQQLEILLIMGELRRDEAARYHVATTLRPAA